MSDYYDLKVLQKCYMSIDSLIDYIVLQNPSLRKYAHPNYIYPNFNNVTAKLILDFERLGEMHITHVLNNLRDYGFLYNLIDDSQFNAVEYDYKHFPFVSDRYAVLREIERIAEKFFQKHTLKFDATCLYLLYFFALLINNDANWIIMDYINNGNKYHKYFVMSYLDLKRF